MGKFVLKGTKDGQFMFNLQAGNGQIILTSERYKQKSSATNGIESVKTNSQDATKFEKLSSDSGKEYFVLKAANGQVVGNSQMYADASSRDAGIESVKTNAPSADVDDQS